jgi:hypothetical protein
MLYTIIYIHRSGSASAAHKISNELGTQDLGEIMHGYRTNPNSKEYIARVNEILSMSQNEDILIKLHVLDLVRIYEYSVDLVKEIFKQSSELYYTIRLDYKSQIISQMISDKTRNWSGNRDTTKVITLKDEKIPGYIANLTNCLSIQGEWFKVFPGELLVLENRDSAPYPKYQFRFNGIKSFLNKEKLDYHALFPDIDVLDIFNKGNIKYTLES